MGWLAAVKVPTGELCGENQAFFLGRCALKQEPETPRGCFTGLSRSESQPFRAGRMSTIYSEYRSASNTAIICALGGGLLTTMFAITFFSGGELDPALWSGGQWFAVCVGLVVVIAITAAQYRLYQSIDGNISGTVITCLILCFVVFSEIATTAERENELVKYRSSQSPTLAVTLDAIRDNGTHQATGYETLITSTQQAIARYQSQLALCANMECQAKYKLKLTEQQALLSSYQQLNTEAIKSRMDNTTLLLNHAKDLEIDERQHTAIVLFMSNIFSVNALSASIFISFIFVVAFELSFHFSASRKAILKRALAQLGYATEKQREPIRVVNENSVLTQTEIAPTEPPQKLDTPTLTDNTESKIDVSDRAGEIEELKRRYAMASNTPKGHEFECPYCKSSLIKTVYNKIFCCSDCKDNYHSAMNPERLKHKKVS